MESITLPPFYHKDPAIWFARVEAVFALNCIKSDVDKYNHVLAALNCYITSLVKDVILSSSAEDKYNQFKTELIRRMAIEQLKKEEIGDRKPSEFYEYLNDMACGDMYKEDIYNIWLEKLPKQIQDVILHANDDCDNEAKCRIADEVIQLLSADTNLEKKSQFPVSFSSELKTLLDEVLMKLKNIELLVTEKVEKQRQCVQRILKLANVSDEPSDQTLETENRKIGENQEEEDVLSDKICWYHVAYGDKACKCVSPCSYRAPEV